MYAEYCESLGDSALKMRSEQSRTVIDDKFKRLNDYKAKARARRDEQLAKLEQEKEEKRRLAQQKKKSKKKNSQRQAQTPPPPEQLRAGGQQESKKAARRNKSLDAQETGEQVAREGEQPADSRRQRGAA